MSTRVVASNSRQTYLLIAENCLNINRYAPIN